MSILFPHTKRVITITQKKINHYEGVLTPYYIEDNLESFYRSANLNVMLKI